MYAGDLLIGACAGEQMQNTQCSRKESNPTPKGSNATIDMANGDTS
jgi:hypothetical protein